ncbi:FRIGIDA-like protein 4a [Arachis stenosperma]|uniref:FRIGIDA-like protein 4a n=1 Tax=Arachis hypogaea TaxID=3818 RepID=UPI000DECBB7A|nr:FRIGIDA-like protein 4a [Arachis hypogaea]XP_057732943.1 FRIGIDA-like protein 4a [Arachis stenosperma]
MGSIPDPGELSEVAPPPSFDEFQRQTSLMTSCTLLWKELSDHFSSLEKDLVSKSEALKLKIRTFDNHTAQSLKLLDHRESSIEGSVQIALRKLDNNRTAALSALTDSDCGDSAAGDGEVDNGEGLVLKLKSFCLRMDAVGFWMFVIGKKKELEALRSEMPVALSECVDPAKFVLEAISEVFPVDKRGGEKVGSGDLGWACVLVLESLIPVVVDPVIGKSRLMVTPAVKERAKEIAETWKASLEERGGIENVKTPDVHTFLQHLVTFGIVKKDDLDLYRKLVIGSAWRKQMPKLALSLGLADEMPDMIEELISKGQQLDAVHFTYEVGLVDKFPPVPLLKSYLKDAKKVASSILEDPNNAGRAATLAARKEQSALRAVIKCIEEYKLEDEFPPENLKKRLDQLEKVKTDKRKPVVVPANKRTRASNSNGGPMPPAKAGRLTNAYVSSFPAAPAFVRSPSHGQYPAALPAYPSPPHMYGSRSPPYAAYSPEPAPAMAGSYPAASMNYPAYGGYGNVMAPTYQQAYYR